MFSLDVRHKSRDFIEISEIYVIIESSNEYAKDLEGPMEADNSGTSMVKRRKFLPLGLTPSKLLIISPSLSSLC